MASGMRWLAVLLLGGALTSAGANTIPTSRGAARQARDELRRAMEANAAALVRADADYREFALSDSLLPLLPDSPGVLLSLAAALPSLARDSLAALAALEAARITRPRGRAGVFLVDNAYGRRPGTGFHGGGAHRELYVGSDSLGAFCALVGTGSVRSDGVMSENVIRMMRGRGEWSVLGPCTFIVRYGAPGPYVSRWLEQGAYAMAEVPAPVDREPAARHGSSAQLSRRLMLWTAGDLRMRGCIGGRDDMCAAVLTAVEAAPERRGAATFELQPAFFYPWTSSSLMISDMEARFGPERFARFWGSADSIDVAFAGAFGIGVDEWVREWGQAIYGEPRLGPGIGALSTFIAACAALIISAVGVLIAGRRTL